MKNYQLCRVIISVTSLDRSQWYTWGYTLTNTHYFIFDLDKVTQNIAQW